MEQNETVESKEVQAEISDIISDFAPPSPDPEPSVVEEKKEEVVVELTPEQKEAALKEALKKRTAG